MDLTMDKSKFYDPYQIISKQRYLNMIVGPRGYGKTYGFKKHVIRKAIAGDGKFVYLRRKRAEMDEMTDFFGDLVHDPYFVKRGYVFRKKGGELFYAEEKDEEDKWLWIHIGSLLALSIEANYKSREFTDYRFIIFDEWLPLLPGGFLRKEVMKFQSLVSTVIRHRTPQIFLIGNSSVLFNPYFEEFKIHPNVLNEYTYHKTKSIVVQLISSEEWTETISETPVGSLFAGTAYEDYASRNRFNDDDGSLVEEMTPNSENILIFNSDGLKIGVWVDRKTKRVYFSEKYNPTVNRKYAFEYDDLNDDYQTHKNFLESSYISILTNARRSDNIRFTSKKAKADSRLIVGRLNLL